MNFSNIRGQRLSEALGQMFHVAQKFMSKEMLYWNGKHNQ